MSDVPEGYRMSEVGVIPKDWDVDKIKNISYITTGAKNTQDKIDDAEYPFFVRSSTVERINSYSFDGEAVLTAGDGVGTGKVIHYINGKFDYHQRVYKISDFNEKIEGYFFYLFFSNYFLKRIMSMTAKSSVDSVRMEMIAEMPIPLPPLPEQQAIASALSDVDALITALEQLITKKCNIKQGAMQQLLTGKKRLPGFGGEWEVKKLGEICNKFLNGGTPSTLKAEYWNGNIPWISGADIVTQKITNIRRFISEDAVKNSSTNIVEKGNILLVTRTGVGKMTIAPFDIAISQDLTGIYIKSEEVYTEYVFHYFNFNSTILKSLNQGTSISGITRNTLTSTPILLPSTIEEQQVIAQILRDMDAEIEALEQKRNKYKAIKQGMMQELLTGKTRLV